MTGSTRPGVLLTRTWSLSHTPLQSGEGGGPRKPPPAAFPLVSASRRFRSCRTKAPAAVRLSRKADTRPGIAPAVSDPAPWWPPHGRTLRHLKASNMPTSTPPTTAAPMAVASVHKAASAHQQSPPSPQPEPWTRLSITRWAQPHWPTRARLRADRAYRRTRRTRLTPSADHRRPVASSARPRSDRRRSS
jgi:hypothetical protein